MFRGSQVFNMWIFLFLILLLPMSLQAQRANIGFWKNACTYTHYGAIDVSGTVLAIATNGIETYIGGDFTSVNGFDRQNLAAVDANGNLLPFDPRMDDTVRTLQVSGSTLYAGGDFTRVGSNWINTRGATIDSAGVVNSSSPIVNGSISVAISDGSGGWFIGGDFTSVGGQSRNRIAALNTTLATNNATSFDPNAGGSTVNALALSGTTLNIGGSFTLFGGHVLRNRFSSMYYMCAP